MSRSKRPKQQESLALPAPTDGSGDAAETSGCLPALVRLFWLLFGRDLPQNEQAGSCPPGPVAAPAASTSFLASCAVSFP